MVKKMISITEAQAAWLQTEADRLGISVSEYIRRALDKLRGVK